MFGNPYYAPYQYPYYAQNADFKQQYQQPIQTNVQQFQGQQAANMGVKNDMLWVLNKNEADSYPVAPNCSVVLWDKNSSTIYVKSMSANGVPSMRTLDYTERSETSQNVSNLSANQFDDKYATLEQISELQDEINALNEKWNNISIPVAAVEEKEKPKQETKTKKGGDK